MLGERGRSNLLFVRQRMRKGQKLSCIIVHGRMWTYATVTAEDSDIVEMMLLSEEIYCGDLEAFKLFNNWERP